MADRGADSLGFENVSAVPAEYGSKVGASGNAFIVVLDVVRMALGTFAIEENEPQHIAHHTAYEQTKDTLGKKHTGLLSLAFWVTLAPEIEKVLQVAHVIQTLLGFQGAFQHFVVV